MPKQAQESRSPQATVVEIPLLNISVNPNQPRQHFREASLAELAESIEQNGLIQPIIVRPLNGSIPAGSYELVAGERRLKAFQLLKRETIPAIVREINEEESREIAIIENLQRDDLSVMEETNSLKRLVDFYEGNIQRVVEKIGKSYTYITERLNLLKLPEEIQKYIDDKKINIAQAKVILEVDGKEAQMSAARYAMRFNLNANELRGRMLSHLKKGGDRQQSSRSGATTYNQLSNLLVRVFDAIDRYNFSTLKDAKKRETIKKQATLVHRSLSTALEQLEQPPTGKAS